MSEAAPRRVRWFHCAALLVLGAVVAALSVPPVLLEHEHHDHNGAYAHAQLKTLRTAQVLFREGDKDGDGLLDYGNLQELSNTLLIDAVLGAGAKQGYRFDVRPSPASPEFLWFAVANPELPSACADRSFCTNHAGVIYYTGRERGPIAFDASCAIPPHVLPVPE